MSDYNMRNLNCGKEYQIYIEAVNGVGASSPKSEVLIAKTLGRSPTAASPEDDSHNPFIVANTTFATLRLELWSDGGCEIMYFTVEYKLGYSHSTWITVSNDLPPQPRYSVRDLHPDTVNPTLI